MPPALRARLKRPQAASLAGSAASALLLPFPRPLPRPSGTPSPRGEGAGGRGLGGGRGEGPGQGEGPQHDLGRTGGPRAALRCDDHPPRRLTGGKA